MIKKYTNSELKYTVRLGEFAQQACGSVWIEYGDTVILSTVTRETSTEFPGFLPLSVDHREHFASAGKIPGGYFKREGKPSDREVLTGRIIDRCMRPLFTQNFFDKVHIVTTVYSIDKDFLPTSVALVASSLALAISNIPFLGPAGCCEISRINGKWIINPTHDQNTQADTRLTVAGTETGINMVEGLSKGISEEEVVNALFIAHEWIKKQIIWQKEVVSDFTGNQTIEITYIDIFNVESWKSLARIFLDSKKISLLFTANKNDRITARTSLWNSFIELYKTKLETEKINQSIVVYAFDQILQELLTQEMIMREKRVDGRNFDTVRSISTDIALLPKNHGSAIFNRGNTQVLVSTTFGDDQDEAKTELLIDETDESSFMLHYNFMPFSVGEAKPLRGAGRREIGHGHLAANAIRAALPEKKIFPYTMRLVADVLESDGSTSMATVCASTLSLMDAGVPIKDMVAGTAMGMVQNITTKEFMVLTDIAAIEDEFGLMDFKVAGTETNITAIQMDIKYKGGLKKEIFSMALEKALIARRNILEIMKKKLSKPRPTLSALVPQFFTFYIPKEKIGSVIGSGGKVIREITDKTKTSINIEDDGLIKVFGMPGPLFEKAIAWIKAIVGDFINGAEFDGIIKKHTDFGCFVEIFPGIDGLVHISTIPRQEQASFRSLNNEGDKVKVVVLEYDSVTNRIRLKIVK